ncbi:YcxB family protein [Mucilaginibacter galii]|uniref:YcxB-like C-terminal domain-containing protein n=1 Tax=Mucilaginibacter galii TaxID=2005073 RepID=A0A917J8M2_9SPHI|nr:YcxB family protein [Mucilaginibacter galii]GGI49304.1 hypothetical protein GCM10011425_05160 [Mucilaginibacter galii]
MKARVTFTAEDLLNNYLFVASKSDLATRRRLKVKLLLVAGCLIGAAGSFIAHDSYTMWGFIIAGILFLLFYQFLQKVIYKQNYKKHAEDRFKALKDVVFDYDITNESISTKSSIGDVVIKTSQIESITETGSYFFIKLKSQDTITLPKHGFDYNLLSAQLNNIAAANSIAVTEELNWRWK